MADVIRGSLARARENFPAPEGANYFHFTWSGPEVQFLIGYADILDLHEASSVEGEVEIDIEVTHRLLLSLRGFHTLKRQMDEIYGSMKDAGVEFPEEEGSV